MNYVFTENQEELRRTVARFLNDVSPKKEVRRLMATEEGFDRTVWWQMATQIGLQGLIVPEQYGGVGLGMVELMLVMEQLGRTLYAGPYLASTIATFALLGSNDEAARKDYLPGIASGETIATFADAEAAGRWNDPDISTAAVRSGNGWLLNGEKRFVLDGAIADLILASARTDSGIGLFAIERGAAGLVAKDMPAIDQTRKLAGLSFSTTPARLVSASGQPEDHRARIMDLTAVALAAEQVGAAQECLDVAVEYAKTRIQFGRPIGSFQAIKHLCADMFVLVDTARTISHSASLAAQEGGSDLPAMASLAKSYCSDAFFQVAGDMIQVHGGIGFTWEHDTHLFFKRAETSLRLFGDSTEHRELLLQRIGV